MTTAFYQSDNGPGRPGNDRGVPASELLDALARAIRLGRCERARRLDAELARIGMAPRLYALTAGGDR